MKFAECVGALLSETRVSARVAMGLKVLCSETSRCDPSESVTRRFSESVIRVGGPNYRWKCVLTWKKTMLHSGKCDAQRNCDPSESEVRVGVWSEVEM